MDSENDCMQILIAGKDKQGKPDGIERHAIAKDRTGPFILIVPAIVLTEEFAAGELTEHGAMPCVCLVALDAYLEELAGKPM